MSIGQNLKRISEMLVGEQADDLKTYTIVGFDGSPYITRTLLPRVGESRPILHHIHRPDFDEHLHNHPWSARFRIMSGGYTEQRLMEGYIVERTYRPGDVNELRHDTFHRISRIEPDTWTFGILGQRQQSWGFLVDGVVIDHVDYFAAKGHVIPRSEGKS